MRILALFGLFFGLVLLVGCTSPSKRAGNSEAMQANNVSVNVSPASTLPRLVVENYPWPDSSYRSSSVPLRYNRTVTVQTASRSYNYTEYSNWPFTNGSTGENKTMQITAFKSWADQHNITIVGVNRSANDFYYNGSTPADFLPIDNVPNVLEVANALYKIPDDLLIVMQGKAFYLSYLKGRGYTIIAPFPQQGILTGMDRGAILEQPLNEEQTVHEFGHLLDFHGIRGMYHDPQNKWADLDTERQRVFNVPFTYEPNAASPPAGYMDVYSTANEAENFAQHFMYYVLHGPEFRQKAQGDAGLMEKYSFFKNKLFNGKEYD